MNRQKHQIVIYSSPDDLHELEFFFQSATGKALMATSARPAVIACGLPDQGARAPAGGHKNGPAPGLDLRFVGQPRDEQYNRLSLKTHHVIKTLASTDADMITKVDITLPGQLSGRGRRADDPLPFDQAAVFDHIRNLQHRLPYSGAYLLSGAKTRWLQGWARLKGGDFDTTKIYPTAQIPPWYSGKLYSINSGFAGFIAEHGAPAAQLFHQYGWGAEDLMVGYLFRQYAHGLEK